MFAFFDGNQFNLRKVLYQSESNSIAGFTLAGGGSGYTSAPAVTAPGGRYRM